LSTSSPASPLTQAHATARWSKPVRVSEGRRRSLPKSHRTGGDVSAAGRVLSLIVACSQARVAPKTKTAGKEGGPAPAGAETARTTWEQSVLTKEGVGKAGKGDCQAGLNALGEEGWELVSLEARAALGGGHRGRDHRRHTTSSGRRRPRATRCRSAGAPGAKERGASPQELSHLMPEKVGKKRRRGEGLGSRFLSVS
jgi:hypothetical protein